MFYSTPFTPVFLLFLGIPLHGSAMFDPKGSEIFLCLSCLLFLALPLVYTDCFEQGQLKSQELVAERMSFVRTALPLRAKLL